MAGSTGRKLAVVGQDLQEDEEYNVQNPLVFGFHPKVSLLHRIVAL
jgi:hypothetical protein